ncbi:MAG: Cof-type HAD-IIB family hydrolase [Oscillospiraceae bacterium]
MGIKLLAIDMDGTCLNSKNRISENTMYWLRRAKDRGIEIVPTTGRTLTCIPYQLKGEGLFRYVITSNGASVTDTERGENIFSALMPLEKATALLKECSGPGIGITAHIGNEYLVQGKLLAMLGRLQYGKDASNSRTVSSLISYAEEKKMDVEEIQLFFFGQKARRRTQAVLAEYDDLAAAYSGIYVEIFSERATKGTALSAVAEHLSVDRKEIACIGDGENDIPMFCKSELRFAMGNAVPELKNEADRVVSSNDEDGVAEAVKYILDCSM